MKKNIKFTLVILLLSHSIANASFIRFWRGFEKSELSYRQFVEGLNNIFLPQTANLSTTDAKLKSYHPVLVNQKSLDLLVPTEVALVEYETEEGYKSYRSTPEGQMYSDSHWDYFDKTKSKSLVPVNFETIIEFEKAYDVGSKELQLSNQSLNFLVISRSESDNNEVYKEKVRNFIQQNFLERRALFVVTEKYVLIYYTGDFLSLQNEQVIMNSELQLGQKIKQGVGIKYDLSI